jgi:uncharacterized protein (TIGR02246 family)
MSKAAIALILCFVTGAATAAPQQSQQRQRTQRPQPAKPPSRTRPAPVPPAVEIGKIVEQFRHAWETNDPTSIRQACADDVVVIGLGRRDRGVESVLENLKVNFQNFPQAELALGQLDVRVVGQAAWAHAEARYSQATAHGSKLSFIGYASLVLERQKPGWRITLIDFDLRQTQAAASETKEPRPVTLEGAWLLELVKNVKTGQPINRAAMAFFTKSRFSLFTVAPDRRPPKDKRLADYAKKDLLEMVRGLDAQTGEYQIDGSRLIALPRLSFFPEATGNTVIFENLKLTRDRFSFELETREGRFEYVWRRVE